MKALTDYIKGFRRQRDIFVDVLKKKNINASTSEKFNTLIEKTQDIRIEPRPYIEDAIMVSYGIYGKITNATKEEVF